MEILSTTPVLYWFSFGGNLGDNNRMQIQVLTMKELESAIDVDIVDERLEKTAGKQDWDLRCLIQEFLHFPCASF